MSAAFISYRHVYPDQDLAEFLAHFLNEHQIVAFTDKQISVGMRWADEIRQQIRESDYFIVLLSKQSILSDMVRQEVKLAYELTQGLAKPFVILPIRVAFTGELPYDLGAYLDPIQFTIWQEGDDFATIGNRIVSAIEQSVSLPNNGKVERDNSSLSGIRELTNATEGSGAPLPSADPRMWLETGTVKLGSPFYVKRGADSQIEKQGYIDGTTTVVKGVRQLGKSSLLARAYHAAQQRNGRAFYLDFQLVDVDPLETLDKLLKYLARRLAKSLGVSKPDGYWDASLGAKENLTDYIEEVILPGSELPVTFLLDEVDLLFDLPYRDQFFATIRGWHNLRATREIWNRLNIIIAHSTEPYLWIQNINQSPFNVGLSIRLEDFSLDEVKELNAKYKDQLKSNNDINDLMNLLGGHPYLIRHALFTLANSNLTVQELCRTAADETGPFSDHLRRYIWSIQNSKKLITVMQNVLRQNMCDDETDFQRLKAAGLVKGETRHSLQMRCQLYAEYFRKHL